jgi:hypothetical protein
MAPKSLVILQVLKRRLPAIATINLLPLIISSLKSMKEALIKTLFLENSREIRELLNSNVSQGAVALTKMPLVTSVASLQSPLFYKA